MRKSKEMAGYHKAVTGWPSNIRSEWECVHMGRSNLVSDSWEPGRLCKITTKSLMVPSWEKNDFSRLWKPLHPLVIGTLSK